MSRSVRLSEDEYWTFVSRPISRDDRLITGKYLLFSSDRERLLTIATDEIERNGFRLAKVSKEAVGGEHVLCLYYYDDSRKHELASKYRNVSSLKYRYWKSDADTILQLHGFVVELRVGSVRVRTQGQTWNARLET